MTVLFLLFFAFLCEKVRGGIILQIETWISHSRTFTLIGKSKCAIISVISKLFLEEINSL
jgi:hypothetical protein